MLIEAPTVGHVQHEVLENLDRLVPSEHDARIEDIALDLQQYLLEGTTFETWRHTRYRPPEDLLKWLVSEPAWLSLGTKLLNSLIMILPWL